jgi:hypothetical protein
MNKQTAVEWLIDNLPQRFKNAMLIDNQGIIEKAKEIEKENLLRSMGIAFNDALEIQQGKKSAYKDWEQFYNETYGGEK